MQRPDRSLSVRALAVAALTLAAQAQIQLPDAKLPPRQEPRPDAPSGESQPGQGGLRDGELPDTTRRADRARRGGGLELPSSRAKPRPGVPSAPPSAAPVVPAPPVDPTPVAPPEGTATAADFVLQEVAKAREVSSTLVEHASLSLLRMGDEGRAAAARALASDHAPTLISAARTLLRSGHASDAELVLLRLKDKLPNAACAPLVDAFADLDPVRASPAALAELLSHRQTAVRTAAQRRLVLLDSAVTLDALARPLASKDGDARLRAIQLVASSRERGATDVLLGHLDDKSGAVARRVVDALAMREDETLDARLLQRALGERWVLRSGAYALLALSEREDLRLVPVLGATHVPRLIEGLGSKDPFVSGACAAALAGIGFRGAEALDTTWLDLDVPHRLVRAVSAEDFSPDFSSIVPTAVRRLHLITGQNFGTDGPRWIEWWAAHAEGFRAARATLPVALDDAPTLDLRVTSELGEAGSYRLVGAARAAELELEGNLSADTLVLSDAQARGLFEVLRESGLFGAGCLPGGRGSSFDPGRALVLECKGLSKSFRFAGGAEESWFVRALDTAATLRSRNRWQLHQSSEFAVPRLEFWRAESPWWDEVTDGKRRAERLRALVHARLEHLPVEQRDAGVEELARLSREGLAPGEGEFDRLVALLSAERFPGPRPRALLALAMAAAAPSDAALPAESAARLVDTWVSSFGPGAPEELVGVLSRAGTEFMLARAADERPFVRAIAATALVTSPGARELEALRALVGDVDPRVQSAALLSLGEARVQAARPEIVARCQRGPTEVRAAALRALGRLAGDGALGILIDAVGESEPAVRSAAAEALGRLEDPGTVPLLVSLLAKGAGDPAYGPARAGLRARGEAAWDDLLRLVRSPAAKSRREAALLLSEQLVPQAVSPLLMMLSEDAEDTRAAEELAILTAVDFRGEPNPSAQWWAWWESVVHDDAQAWLVGAVSRLNLPAPGVAALRDGRPEAVELFARLARREEPWLAERARREFSRLVGRDVGALPPRGRERDAWLAALAEQLAQRRKE